MKKNPPSFNHIYMNLAANLALRSHCVKQQVGAVLAKDTRIVSLGYNGPPAGTHNCDEEWPILTDYLGGEELAGAKMKSNYGWKNNEKPESISGFNGLPGGWRSDFGTFYGIGSSVSWWSSAKYINSTEWERRLAADNPHVYTLDTLSNSYTRGLISSNGLVYRAANNKQNGYSVRCIKD